MNAPQYPDCHDAIRDANAASNHCVGWDQEHCKWVVYNPLDGRPSVHIIPEFFCVRSGSLPIALTNEAVRILRQMLKLNGAS
jgi:hypothetical protein